MKQNINITLDEEIIKKLKEEAKKEHSSISATLNKILWKFFERR